MIRRSYRTILAALACSILTVPILGQGPKPATTKPIAETPTKSQAVPTSPHEMTASDVESFLDGLMPLQLERDDIAGAVVAVVKDGKVILAKGYGYADVEKQKAVSAGDTLFRIGSISKLFTWTAVMQLVEQGKLDLDRNINDYLDFKIPDTFAQPITLRNLMTHRPGFGETAKDLFIRDAKAFKPLDAYVKAHVPRRIFPPGIMPAYSNYGTTLAGYIVQRVSGRSFNDYIAEHILKPLDMQKTTFVQPLPGNLEPLMSAGYRKASAGAKPFELVQAWPAGSVAASAVDMMHFIIAHLQNGEYNGARILKADTAELMHSRQSGFHPDMHAMALGFYEESRNGHRIIGHGGDTAYFHSDLHLIPDANVGFFVSYNSAGRGDISQRTALFQKFLDRYLPYTSPVDPAIATAAADANSVSGTYLVSRRFEGNVLEGLSLLGETHVYRNSDNTVSVEALKGFNGQPKKFREIAPLSFREVNGQDRIAFNKNANGKLVLAIDYPFMVFERASLLRSKGFNQFLVFTSVGIMVLAIVLWPVAAMVRKHYGRRLSLAPVDRRLRLIVRITCVLNLVFMAGFVGLVAASSDPGKFNDSLDPKLHLLQIIGVLGALGAIAAVYNAVRIWLKVSSTPQLTMAAAASGEERSGGQPIAAPRVPQRPWFWTRVFETAIALACLAFIWLTLYWNLLNFKLNY